VAQRDSLSRDAVIPPVRRTSVDTSRGPPTQAGARAKLIIALVDGMVVHHLARGADGEISDELARAVVAVAVAATPICGAADNTRRLNAALLVVCI
jgi:hypothetical protein